jgi:hypothetical protein
MARELEMSRLSAAEFARQHGLSDKTVYRWLGRLGRTVGRSSKPRSSPELVPVRIVASVNGKGNSATKAELDTSELDIVIGGSRVIRVRRGFDDQLLRRVVAALEEGSC